MGTLASLLSFICILTLVITEIIQNVEHTNLDIFLGESLGKKKLLYKCLKTNPGINDQRILIMLLFEHPDINCSITVDNPN